MAGAARSTSEASSLRALRGSPRGASWDVRVRARATHLAPRFGCGRRTTRARAKSRDSRHMAKEKRGKEAKAKAEEATKEVTAGAAHAASGVSGAAGAVTEEAARLAGDAADSVKGAVETAGDAAKSISRSITSAVGGAIHKARRPAHPRGAPIFSQLGFPSPRPARRVRARFLGRDERRHVRSKSYSYATAPRFQLALAPTDAPILPRAQGAEALDVNQDGKVDAKDITAAADKTASRAKRCVPAECVVS